MDLRFDIQARVEVWVTAREIREADGYAAIVNCGNTQAEIITQLRGLARRVAEEKIAGVRGVEITAELNEMHDVNPDRIRWDVLATPERKLEFVMTVTQEGATRATREVFVKAAATLDDDGWRIGEVTVSTSKGFLLVANDILDQVDAEVLRRCERATISK